MLFNSYAFLFGYLPLTLLGYQLAARWNRLAVVSWLALASLAFYAYWRPMYLLLLGGSILVNFAAGALISRRIPNRLPPKAILWSAIALNLGALCYFKYLFPLLNFFGHGHSHWADVALPLGISFFTFTQIAYLVDLEQGAAAQQDLASYTLFVTFFPHLIAGPILHHSEIMPQFQRNRDFRLRADDLAVGGSWFVMGLLKKVLLADSFLGAADAAFAAPAGLGMRGAWVGSLSYALQLYFDFSGYSDMALGLARMFSIDFPLNFSSPYKSDSIIDFWQRWHMTLSRYINVYLYNPISVAIYRRRARQGKKITRKANATVEGFLQMIALPTVVTMFLAGVWHGAGMQFVIFGLLHAVYLSINHAWRVSRPGGPKVESSSTVRRALVYTGNVVLTFGAVVLAQIFFRANSSRAALQMLAAMAGLHRHLVPAAGAYTPALSAIALLIPGFLIVWTMPNTQQILARFHPETQLTAADKEPAVFAFLWRPTALWAVGLGCVFFFTLIRMQDPTKFLYFQF